jgi:pyruvate/2-oxoglutarate dehydrogenase complex dihydrolipoamide acyltransferase (E2) component
MPSRQVPPSTKVRSRQLEHAAAGAMPKGAAERQHCAVGRPPDARPPLAAAAAAPHLCVGRRVPRLAQRHFGGAICGGGGAPVASGAGGESQADLRSRPPTPNQLPPYSSARRRPCWKKSPFEINRCEQRVARPHPRRSQRPPQAAPAHPSATAASPPPPAPAACRRRRRRSHPAPPRPRCGRGMGVDTRWKAGRSGRGGAGGHGRMTEGSGSSCLSGRGGASAAARSRLPQLVACLGSGCRPAWHPS